MTDIQMKSDRTELILPYSFGIIFLILAGIYFQIVGYPLVNTATGTLDVVTPPSYMLPIFFPFGLLVGDVIRLWWFEKNHNEAVILLVECIAVGFLSFFRLFTTIPFSGHTIILGFFLLNETYKKDTISKDRLSIGLCILILTAFFKIVLWADSVTMMSGLVLGVIIWVPGCLVRQRRMNQT